MAWIELHQNLPAHRKVKKLKRLLKIKTPQAVGHLAMLWLWAVDNAPDGDLSALDPEDIDNQMAMIVGLTEAATFGDARAAKVILEMLGDDGDERTDLQKARELLEGIDSAID